MAALVRRATLIASGRECSEKAEPSSGTSNDRYMAPPSGPPVARPFIHARACAANPDSGGESKFGAASGHRFTPDNRNQHFRWWRQRLRLVGCFDFPPPELCRVRNPAHEGTASSQTKGNPTSGRIP